MAEACCSEVNLILCRYGQCFAHRRWREEGHLRIREYNLNLDKTNAHDQVLKQSTAPLEVYVRATC